MKGKKRQLKKGVPRVKGGFIFTWEELKPVYRLLGDIQSRRREKLVGTSPLGLQGRGCLRGV